MLLPFTTPPCRLPRPAVGRIAPGGSFEPSAGAILKNRDELRIPLKLAELPTPQAFKEAIASLSPEQIALAEAFRGMQVCAGKVVWCCSVGACGDAHSPSIVLQLESSLFGVLVVHVKPQLELLLNLPPDALTKEVALTQDLTELFIKYQASGRVGV